MNEQPLVPKLIPGAGNGRDSWKSVLPETCCSGESAPGCWGGGAIQKARLASGGASIPAPMAARWVKSTSEHRDRMMIRKKEKLEMPVCTRVSASKFRTLEAWCDNSFRKRSEVVGMVLERVLDLLEQQAWVDKPVEEFVRRLRANGSQ